MGNAPLRQALMDVGLGYRDLTGELQVDPKTVERWVSQGRVPYPRHRTRIAQLVGVGEMALWPELAEREQERRVEEWRERESLDLVELFPHRGLVTPGRWLRLVTEACEHVDVLAWAATFFHQLQPNTASLLADAAGRGAKVRLCFGDPASTALATREIEEPLLGVGVLAGKVRVSLGYYRELVDVDGIEVRLHDAVVYASLFRYDDEVMVNPHIYARPASENPVLHLRRGDLFDRYVASFETVWDTAMPWKGEQV